MKILQVTPSLENGGAERFVVDLCLALRERGHEVEVLSLWSPEGLSNWRRLVDNGVTVHTVRKRPGPRPHIVAAIAPIVRRIGPDLIHTHRHALEYMLPWLGRFPSVHTIHNEIDREAGRLGFIARRVAFKRGTIPVALGEGLARNVLDRYKVASEYVANGVPAATSQASPPSSALKVVMVGALREDKDPALGVQIAQLARARGVPVELDLIGDGPLRGEVEKVASSLDADYVTLRGWSTTVRDELSAYHVLLNTSKREGMPLAVLEAMACGVVPVAADVGALRETVGEAGGVFQRANPEVACEWLASLWNAEVWSEFSEKAKKRYGERFSLDRMAARYEEVYARAFRAEVPS